MLKRVKKVLVAKNVSRTSALTASTLYTGTNGPAAGEIIVLDKNKKLLSSGATVTDTDTIYIAVGTSETYSVTNEAGTTTTGIRKLILSDPIEAGNIKTYVGKAYAAATENVCVLDFTGTTPVAGDSYVVRLVFKDIPEHPGQFTHTYRVISADATLANLLTKITAKINAHTGARVTATCTSTAITITAKVVSDASSSASANAIDEYRQVNFEAFVWRYDNTNFLTVDLSTTVTKTYTNPYPGAGTAKLVRDEEKRALSHRGITNQWYFPVVKPDLLVDMTATYDTIIIESNKKYLSADNQYEKNQPLSTLIFIPSGSSQTTDFLSVLNPWMESAGFTNVSF